MSKYLTEHNFPEDLRNMDYDQLELLSYELRDFLLESVSKTGGHLASNLGIVELTIALHKCFDTPHDKIIWDVGHQSYIHKMLTGRMDAFDTLRKYGGISGFPKACESEYDVFDTGHSSTSISLGLGLAAARDLNGEDYKVVSVIGDGAMTGGLAFEALNNAGSMQTNLIVVLNDNGMSISKNIGGLSGSLGRITSTDKYLHLKTKVKKGISKVPVIGESMVSGIHHAKENIKYAVIDGILFEELGFKYIGPVDGHDIKELCETLDSAKSLKGPVLVHAVTCKGKGYSHAEKRPHKYHGIGAFDLDTGAAVSKSSGKSYSAVFGDKLTDMAAEDHRIIGITAAMADGVGLEGFQKTYPKRFFDVGIAEAHGVTFAAGLAKAGQRPYVAVYSSFLQRAYDQMLEDVCLQNLPVTFCIDRAGAVGADGETHHGLFDIAYMRSMPNMTVFAPKLKEGNDVDLWAVGNMTEHALAAAEMLQEEGIGAGVVNTASVKPLDLDMLHASASSVPLIVTIEDGIVSGGIGEAIKAGVSQQDTEVINLGWPDQFIEHGTQNELYEKYGLDARSIAETVKQNIK